MVADIKMDFCSPAKMTKEFYSGKRMVFKHLQVQKKKEVGMGQRNMRVFFSPTGICTEFNHVVYVCDYKTGSIHQITILKQTASFLTVIRNLVDAFSVHEKHKKNETKLLQDAIVLVSECLDIMQNNTHQMNESHENLPKKLNGPEGSISAKTLDSIKILDWGLNQLERNMQIFEYTDVNLLSCMTLDIEHLHSTFNRKHCEETMLQYARSFSTSIKESVKSLVAWSAYYFTRSATWYPLPVNTLQLRDVKFPAPILPANMSNEDILSMREWASSNGRVVRQRSVRQETTMAKAGTKYCM